MNQDVVPFWQWQTAEVWLRTNTRALLFGMVLPGIVALVGLVLVLGLVADNPPNWLRVVGAVMNALGLLVVGALVVQWKTPRLAYREGHLLVRLTSGPPIRVPVDVVECFWLGQAPSLLPGKRHEKTETASVVARIAEAATDWHHRDVKPQLGSWCQGYITIRGTWCEPLSIDLINRLNQRLADVQATANRV